MQRRDFLKLSAALGLGGCLQRLPWQQPPVSVLRPGMQMGHRLRDGLPPPDPARERSVDVAILGSGVGGLFAGWRLAQQGYKDFCVLTGPEAYGNAASGVMEGIAFPRGAHYLPLPSMESIHVREMLAAFGVLSGDPAALKPVYDELALVHAPEERLLIGGRWQEGLLPQLGLDEAARAQAQRFVVLMQGFREARGEDGRRAFAIPLAASSRDPAFRRLDAERFDGWLDRHGFSDPALRAYADYCCRDDYGVGIQAVSAWAGIHYFASRGGHADNAEDGAVLTWPQGLNALSTRMAGSIGAQGFVDGTALAVRERRRGVDIQCLAADGKTSFLLKARRAVMAMPLHVAGRICDLSAFGFDKARDLPASAAWMVSSFLLNGYPAERDEHTPLAWDNVVHGSRSLGWVVATHQWIRQARPEKTLFTTYHAFADQPSAVIRNWLLQAEQGELQALAGSDLRQVYGAEFERRIEKVEITLRGHAMASPTPGFLARPGIEALRGADGALLFAHADLSGLSVFEEAAWWGECAARKILSA